MENSARYTLIGAFALACLLGAFGFVYWIKNVGGLGQRRSTRSASISRYRG